MFFGKKGNDSSGPAPVIDAAKNESHPATTGNSKNSRIAIRIFRFPDASRTPARKSFAYRIQEAAWAPPPESGGLLSKLECPDRPACISRSFRARQVPEIES